MRKITKATINDCTLLTALSTTTFRAAFASYNAPSDMDAYLETAMNQVVILGELADKNNTFFLLWDAGNLAGYAKMRVDSTPPDLAITTAIELERIYLLPEYIGMGAGYELIRHCIDYAFSANCTHMWLGVWEHNKTAIEFYKRLGFEQFGSHIFRLGTDDQTDLLYVKLL